MFFLEIYVVAFEIRWSSCFICFALRINYIGTFHLSQFWSFNSFFIWANSAFLLSKTILVMTPFLKILSIKKLCGWLLNSKFNVFACSDGSKSRPGLFLGLRLKFLVEDENLRLKLFCSGSLCSINFQTGFLGLDPSLFANLIDSADKSPFWISKFECVYILSIAE